MPWLQCCADNVVIPVTRSYACKWCFEMLPDVDDDKINTEIWCCNYCKIIVMNSNVKLIDDNKIQRLLIGFSLGCPLTGAQKQRKNLSRNL